MSRNFRNGTIAGCLFANSLQIWSIVIMRGATVQPWPTSELIKLTLQSILVGPLQRRQDPLEVLVDPLDIYTWRAATWIMVMLPGKRTDNQLQQARSSKYHNCLQAADCSIRLSRPHLHQLLLQHVWERCQQTLSTVGGRWQGKRGHLVTHWWSGRPVDILP